jgi:hypothetical protein
VEGALGVKEERDLVHFRHVGANGEVELSAGELSQPLMMEYE